MPEPTTTTTTREPCATCSSTTWTEAHFVFGRIVCLTCWRGSQRPAVSMPPTPRERQLLFEWIRPLNRGARP